MAQLNQKAPLLKKDKSRYSTTHSSQQDSSDSYNPAKQPSKHKLAKQFLFPQDSYYHGNNNNNYYDDAISDEFGFVTYKNYPSWKIYLRYAAGMLLILCFIFPVLYLALTADSRFVKVPDLIRVKSRHVLAHEPKLSSSPSTNSLFKPGSSKKKHDVEFPLKDRIILVGDVHGNIDQLVQLMEKVSFDPEHDELVLLGDLISKGPDSIGVLDYAIENNASCIRGNHEDSILFAYTSIRHLPSPKVEPVSKYENEDGDGGDDEEEENEDGNDQNDGSSEYNGYIPDTIKDSDIKIARQLRAKHIEYLGSCPLIMDLGYISEEGSRVVGVHSGLHWDIRKLYKQPPRDVMTMRSLLPPEYTEAVETSDGRQWSKVWNEKQKLKPIKKRLSIFYGHDARHGLNLRDYSFGLDSNCIGGGQLTATVITKTANRGFKHTRFSVDCSEVASSTA